MADGQEEPAKIGKGPPTIRGTWRVALPVILAMIAGGALLTGMVTGRVPGFGFWLKFATMLATAGIIAYLQFRSSVLALAAALGPLPASAIVLCLALRMPAPFPFSLPGALVYAFGFLVIVTLIARTITSVPEGAPLVPHPGRRGDAIAAGAVAATALFMPAIVALIGPQRLSLEAFLLAAGNGTSVLIAPMAVAVAREFLADDEDYIARTNRIREGWTRLLEPLSSVGRSPWNWSTTGIFVVFVVLAAFAIAGARSMGVAENLREAASYAAVFLLIASFAVARDWRRALAVWFVGIAIVPVAMWGYARSGANLGGLLVPATADLWVLGFVPIASVAASATRSGREDPESALAAGIVEAGPAAAMGVIATLLMLGPWYREEGTARLGIFLAVGFAAGGALVFQPALAGAIYQLVPRRKSLAERYRIK